MAILILATVLVVSELTYLMIDYPDDWKDDEI
jgi:hypothetical protein